MSDFNPPIKERSTEELLLILGQEEEWQPEAVDMAKAELGNRGVGNDRISQAKQNYVQEVKKESSRKSNEGYLFLDFLFDPGPTLFEIIFSWELAKDGFHRKARQQKKIRMGLLIILVIGLVYLATTS